MKRKRRNNRRLYDALETAALCVLALAIALFFQFCVIVRINVDGQSMEPNFQNGDALIADTISYRFTSLKRFDVIIFNVPNRNNDRFIKRVIGLPGETVRIDEEGIIFIDGIALDEHFGKETIENPGNAENGITLGPDEYFVLGDNRNASEDSRFDVVGKVKYSDILGRAAFRIYPFSSAGPIKR